LRHIFDAIISCIKAASFDPIIFLCQDILAQQQNSTKLVMINNNLQPCQEHLLFTAVLKFITSPRTDMIYKVPKDFLASRDYGFNKMGALIKF
jgi:hypothetical protein